MHKRVSTTQNEQSITKRSSQIKESTTVTRTSVTQGLGFRASNAL